MDDETIIIDKEKLESWLRLKDWNLSKLANALNYDIGNLSKILSGEKEPSKQIMKKLMRITGLGWNLFNDPNNGKFKE